ncbi:iron chelate uptake ABC transporter family permease subunit [Psychrobacter frigidicola]|uniref:Iron chelate uptake ABC transporter family permease subunit n=1 Tax=Psychrobacter frigidicola TaxID=45611 RepID=A0A5C7A5G2_9GAMM|nr:iron chelate uptake ABC transporter family permease subunit [Psychrobacter frigidicola]TXD98418.1 iron chelate uptake ABC transporter family permease subunit [Psychrobacter frigidicola]
MRSPSASTTTDTDPHTHTESSEHGKLLGFWARLWETITQHPKSIASIILLISAILFLTVNVHGHWDFALPLRGKKLLALMVVGYAIGVSTLLFQTLTHNPILTPSLLGFDSLYVLLQSLLVFFLGSISYTSINPITKFGLEIVLMFGASLLLFRLLFSKSSQDLTRLILVGVIFGVLFRSLSALIARLINPDDFVVVQSASYAQFNTVNPDLLSISIIVCAISAVFIWRWRYQCDVLMLGKDQAINLGINYQRLAFGLLTVIAILVATATALVGPVTFFGLLVCALTNRLARNMAHSERLILVSLVAMICLVLGQTVFEQVLGMAGVLSVVIELAGGLVFLVLIFMTHRR